MKPISVDLIDTVTPIAQERLRQARRLPHLRYADLRLEVTEGKGAGSENGTPKFSGDDYGFSLGVRVLAGERMIAPGYVGQVLGTADVDELDRIIQEALERAYRRAMVNGEMKADAREKYGALGAALADTHLHPIPALQDTVAAVYRVDPRTVDLAEMVRYATDVSRQVAAVDARVKYNYVSTLTELSRELFVSTEGARIDQSFALTQGTCSIVTARGEVSQDLYDALGHQRGWEILLEGIDEPLLRFPTFLDFALGLPPSPSVLAPGPSLFVGDSSSLPSNRLSLASRQRQSQPHRGLQDSPASPAPSNSLLLGESVAGVCVLFLVAPVGELRSVEGVGAAEAMEGVRWVRVYRRSGWRFGPLLRGGDRAGAILAVGTSREDALQRARRAAQAVRFEVDEDTA